MTMILVPDSGGEGVQINQWNWKPTVAYVRSLGIIDDDTAMRLTVNGTGGFVDAEQAKTIAAAISKKIGAMKPADRLLMDQSVTNTPKTRKLDDPTLYSATYEWLRTFQSFCESSGGFKAV